MTLEEATDKVKSLAENHQGKFNSTANLKFDEGVIHIDDTVSPVDISNEERAALCTLRMSISDFSKMAEGNLNPMMAFMTGKMKIDGDKGVAMKLSSFF